MVGGRERCWSPISIHSPASASAFLWNSRKISLEERRTFPLPCLKAENAVFRSCSCSYSTTVPGGDTPVPLRTPRAMVACLLGKSFVHELRTWQHRLIKSIVDEEDRTERLMEGHGGYDDFHIQADVQNRGAVSVFCLSTPFHTPDQPSLKISEAPPVPQPRLSIHPAVDLPLKHGRTALLPLKHETRLASYSLQHSRIYTAVPAVCTSFVFLEFACGGLREGDLSELLCRVGW